MRREAGVYPGIHETTSEDELLAGYKGVSIDFAPGIKVIHGDVVTLRLTFEEGATGISVTEALVLSIEHADPEAPALPSTAPSGTGAR